MMPKGDCKKILVIDDDQSIRTSLSEILEDEGYTVDLAGNGSEAIARLTDPDLARPCVILLDLMMPVMDGAQFRALQMQDGELAAIPVVVISADGMALAKAAGLKVAAALRKPVHLEDVLRAVETYC